MQDFQQSLQQATVDALQRYEAGMGIAFPAKVRVEAVDDYQFGAGVFETDGNYIIEVNLAVQSAINQLWQDALQSSILIDDEGNRVADVDGSPLSQDRLTHLSLTWLVLHELMHIKLGHLDMLESAQLVETETSNGENHSDKARLTSDLAIALSPEERKLFRPCLELQADNEATEVMFGIFAEGEWGRFRIDAAAIFVVMALMEKADIGSSNNERTYPRVATRFFSLFAQLFQYWLYSGAELEAGDGESFVITPREPKGEEFQRYMKFVLALTINDVVQIASWAEADGFLADLGGGGALFQDIYDIQYAPILETADLQTNAAKEWQKLLPVNEKIMAITGLRE